MIVSVKKNVDASWSDTAKQQHRWALLLNDGQPLSPLAVTTAEFDGVSYLISENEFGEQLTYYSGELFDVLDSTPNDGWVVRVIVREPGKLHLFLGYDGLHDDTLIESVIDRESDAALRSFRNAVAGHIWSVR